MYKYYARKGQTLTRLEFDMHVDPVVLAPGDNLKINDRIIAVGYTPTPEDNNPWKPPKTREAIGEPTYEYKAHPYLSEILWFGAFMLLLGLCIGVAVTAILI